jgi:hypothetical protein
MMLFFIIFILSIPFIALIVRHCHLLKDEPKRED